MKARPVRDEQREDKAEEEAKKFASHMKQNTNEWPVYYFSSDTSGEKMFEEFYTEQEQLDMDTFSSLGIIKNAPRRSFTEILNMISKLSQVLESPSLTKTDIVQVLSTFLPSFHHIETGKSLDQKM